jgi:hypothetical protein
MERFPYDRSSKWLMQHHGDLILRLGGVRDIVRWRALQSEVVQPRQLPDGLLEVLQVGQKEVDYYIAEVWTYPDQRIGEQVMADATLVLQDRGFLPEVLVLVLCPKGIIEAASETQVVSRAGWTRLQLTWRTVNLWTLSAESLLATSEPGLVPWVALTQFEQPPEQLFQRCRAIIDEKAKPEEHENLLAVTQVLMSLRYNTPSLRKIFGGKEGMIESPALEEVLQEVRIKTSQTLVLGLLEARFKSVPADLAAAVTAVTDEDRLKRMNNLAGQCADLAAFRQQLQS